MSEFTHDDETEVSNEQLMEAFYDGDDDAFGQLWGRCSSMMVSFARRCLPGDYPGREQAAEDCASECLMKALATKHRPSAHWNPQRGKVSTWLCAMVRNQSRDMLRKERRQSTPECGLTDLNGSFLDPVANDNQEAVADQQQRTLLWEMVAQLPNELATIVTLKHRDGLKHREIAAQLGCSPPTITRCLREARQLLIGMRDSVQAAA